MARSRSGFDIGLSVQLPVIEREAFPVSVADGKTWCWNVSAYRPPEPLSWIFAVPALMTV